MKHSVRWLALGGLAWLLLVTAAYYRVNKPLDIQAAAGLGLALLRLTLAGGLAALAGAIGRRFAPGLGLRPLTQAALQAALGLGVMGAGVLLVGSLLGVSPLLAWAALLGLGWVFRKDMLAWLLAWGDLGALWRSAGRLEKLVGVLCGGLLGFGLVTALAPPLKFDALVYHFTLPKMYLAAGRVTYVPELMFWGMPQTGEMLYTWAYALAGIETAAVIGWLFGLLALAGLLAFGVQRLGTTQGWLAVGTLMAGFSFSSALSWGYVDWLTLLFGLGAFACLDLWAAEEERPVRLLILGGMFAGFALGTKYTAGVVLLAGLGLVGWYSRRAGWRQALWAVVVFGLAAGLVSLPWWMKNLATTGSPFYPFFLPAGAMNSLRLDLYQDQPAWLAAWQAPLLPWLATVNGREAAVGFSASIGPLLLGLGVLAFLPTSLAASRHRQTLSAAALFFGLGWLVWAFASLASGLLVQTRLYWALFPAAALLAGAGFAGVQAVHWPGVRLRRVFGVLVLLVLGLNGVQSAVALQRQGSARWLTTQVSTQEYLQTNLGMAGLVFQSLMELPENSRVLMLWEPRSFYCTPVCVPDEVVDRWLMDWRQGQNPGQMIETWQAAGFSHVLVNQQGVSFYRTEPRYNSADWQGFEQVLDKLVLTTDYNQVYTLYALPGP